MGVFVVSKSYFGFNQLIEGSLAFQRRLACVQPSPRLKNNEPSFLLFYRMIVVLLTKILFTTIKYDK